MNKEQDKINIAALRYGFKAKIFKNSTIYQASIYLDNLYDNFLWISTNQDTYIVDLCFTTISYYSLQLELNLKHYSKYPQQASKKYILLKQLNTQIPIIFNEQKATLYSSQQNINAFAKGRTPNLYASFENYIMKKKENCHYSPNFSRYFKKMRLQLQIILTQSFTQFSIDQITNALNSITDFSQIPKTNLFQQGKKVSSTQIIQILKLMYCKLNDTAIKSMFGNDILKQLKNSNKSILNQKVINLGDGYLLTCFDALMKLENSFENYIIPKQTIDQNLPLTDYFCFSSHNTYLTGNQITSDCKITRYIEDLKKGIKCVELDVHNKGDNQPVITHAVKGKGFCKPITFRGTIQSIDQFLQFHKDHYPIILSIENHANRQNQDLMNNILRKQFPKNILVPNQKNQFYKLSQIKGKIIVKTSCNLESLNQFKNNDQTPKIKSYDINNMSKGFSITESQSGFKPNQQHPYQVSLKEQNYQQTQNAQYRQFLRKIQKFKNLKIKFNQKIDQNSYLPVQKIVQITCIFKAQKGIETVKPNPFECSSMQNAKIAKTTKQKIINYTKQAWLRSYPEGTQVYSNNYDFSVLLAKGVQIIALNTQTNDDYAIMMNSYFRAGRTGDMAKIGYIQKPQYLRTINGKISTLEYPSQRNFEFAFYTNLQMQFSLYSIDGAKVQQKSVMDNVKRVTFKLGYYNESFLIIKFPTKKLIECIPLRFLPYQRNNQKVYKTIIGRDYEFEDTGVRIICSFKWF